MIISYINPLIQIYNNKLIYVCVYFLFVYASFIYLPFYVFLRIK